MPFCQPPEKQIKLFRSHDLSHKHNPVKRNSLTAGIITCNGNGHYVATKVQGNENAASFSQHPITNIYTIWFLNDFLYSWFCSTKKATIHDIALSSIFLQIETQNENYQNRFMHDSHRAECMPWLLAINFNFVERQNRYTYAVYCILDGLALPHVQLEVSSPGLSRLVCPNGNNLDLWATSRAHNTTRLRLTKTYS